MSSTASESNGSIDPQSLEAFLEEADEEQDSTAEAISNAKRRRTGSEAECSYHERHVQPPIKSGFFSLLPEELSLQLLERLSAVDLTSVSQTCKFFSRIARGNDLWRPLYSCRWREVLRDNAGAHDQGSWKASYMERDAQRGAQVASLIPDKALQTAYLQSLVAERHKIVDRLPQAAEPSYKLLWARITRWRGARGLLTCPSPALGSQHLGCSKRGPFVELLGGLYMCEGCGWAHQCGDSCPEKLVDEVSQSLVCPISGRCFDRMMLDWEEEGRDEVEGDTGCDFGVAGHWGRAYAVGYNCSSEEELRYQCGVVM